MAQHLMMTHLQCAAMTQFAGEKNLASEWKGYRSRALCCLFECRHLCALVMLRPEAKLKEVRMRASTKVMSFKFYTSILLISV